MKKYLIASACLWALLGFDGLARGQAVPAPNFGFAPDPGTQLQLQMLEGTGSTVLHDSSGYRRDIAISTSCVQSSWASTPVVPTWTADSGLQFGPSAAYLCAPAAVQNIQRIEIDFSGAVVYKDTSQANAVTIPNQPALAGYNGADPGPNLLLNTGYTGNSAPSQGFAATVVGSYMSGDGSGIGTTGSIDNARHVVIMGINAATGARTIWLDGVLQPAINPFTSPAPATSGGVWSFGGGELGTIGKGWGQTGCSCVIHGVSLSATFPTVAIVSQNTKAWRSRDEYTGVSAPAAFGPIFTGNYLLTIGQSISWGHGLATPNTQAFSYLARDLLASSTGQPWKADTDGEDNASAYAKDGKFQTELSAVAPGIRGAKVVLFDTNGNDERGYNNWPDQNTSTASGIISTAYRSLAAMGARAAVAKGSGWITGLGFEFPSGNGNLGADANQKDVTNRIWRIFARQFFDFYFDAMSDPRIGSDGASTTYSASGDTSCTLAGVAGPTWQTDKTHPTACGESIIAQDYAEQVQYVLNTKNGATTDVIAATSGTLPATDAGNSISLTGAGASMRLLQCGGQMQGEVLATITNAGSTAATIMPGIEPNGGPTDTMNGGTAGFSLPAAKTASFIVSRGTDAAGTCGIVSSS